MPDMPYHDQNIVNTLAPRLALLATYTPNMVMITDEAGCLEWVNPSFEKQTGYALNDLIGKRVGDVLFGEDTDPQTVKRIRQKLYENAAFEEDLLQYTRSGSPYWVHIHCFPIGPEQGVKPGFIAIQYFRPPANVACELRQACLIAAMKRF